MLEVIEGLMIPFVGTTLGAGCVFFLKDALNRSVQRGLTGFAAGIMVAASIWSLLIPAMEGAADMGSFAFFPAVAGFWAGTLFLLLLDHIIPHLHMNAKKAEGPHSRLSRTTMLVLAVTLHNIPEGMAVGAIYAGWLSGSEGITLGAALALSLGIALQNFPEGAIISMPLRTEGNSKAKSFWYGMLSGAVEPSYNFAARFFDALVRKIFNRRRKIRRRITADRFDDGFFERNAFFFFDRIIQIFRRHRSFFAPSRFQTFQRRHRRSTLLFRID